MIVNFTFGTSSNCMKLLLQGFLSTALYRCNKFIVSSAKWSPMSKLPHTSGLQVIPQTGLTVVVDPKEPFLE